MDVIRLGQSTVCIQSRGTSRGVGIDVGSPAMAEHAEAAPYRPFLLRYPRESHSRKHRILNFLQLAAPVLPTPPHRAECSRRWIFDIRVEYREPVADFTPS